MKLLNELFHLPKWKHQKEFVDNLEIDDPKKWLVEVDRIWDSIPSDRKDKFYYLVDKLSCNISDIEFISTLDNIKYHIVTNNIQNFTSTSLFEYIKSNKIYDFALFSKFDFNLDEVKNILKEEKVINREFLSRYILNNISK